MTNFVISLRDVEVDYELADGGTFHALRDINMDVREGDYVAIMGASGSGKTTLSNIIGLLARPTRGEYKLLKEDTEQISNEQLSELRSQHIGFIFQDYLLIEHLSAVENVALPLVYDPRMDRRHALEIARARMALLGLRDKYNHLPSQLSGGQKQRVAIARALVKEPKLILADEPAGALDVKSRFDVLSILQKLNSEGVTIVMVTHSEEDARAANRLIRIDTGRIIEDVPQKNRIRFYTGPEKSGQDKLSSALGELMLTVGVDTREDWLHIAEGILESESRQKLIRQIDRKWLRDADVVRYMNSWFVQSKGIERALIIAKFVEGSRASNEKSRTQVVELINLSKWEENDAIEIIHALAGTDDEYLHANIQIRKFLLHESPKVRAAGVKLIRDSDLSTKPELKVLAATLLEDVDTRVRSNILERAPQLGFSYEELKAYDFDKDTNPRVRVAWGFVLIKFKKFDEMTALLAPMFESNDPEALRAAAVILSQRTGKGLREILDILLKSSPNRAHIMSTLGEALVRGRAINRESTIERESTAGRGSTVGKESA